MAKITYELIGSFYDSYAGEYQNEQTIELENVSLDSLEQIDAFTCCLSKSALIKRLENKYPNKNTFSIKVKNKNGVFFMPVVFEQPDLIAIINSIRKKDVMTRDGYTTFKVIYSSDPLVKKVISPIAQVIEEKNIAELSQYVDENSRFYHHIQRYIQSDDQDCYEFENLGLEARNYQTFRSNLLYQKKLEEVRSHYQFQEAAFRNKKTKLVTPSHAPSTEIHFGQTYAKAKTLEYNTQNEKEEFLDEEEVAKITGYNDTFIKPPIVKESAYARR